MAEKLLESKVNAAFKRATNGQGDSAARTGFVPIFAMSAGIAAGGGPASPLAITALDEIGVDLADHESCAVSEKEIDSADLILAMTRGHLQAIMSKWPCAAKRALLLHPDGQDVSDPYGGPLSMYRDAAQKISTYLDVWLERFSSMPLPKWVED
jgi:protein-tyrosine-phosphatase